MWIFLSARYYSVIGLQMGGLIDGELNSRGLIIIEGLRQVEVPQKLTES